MGECFCTALLEFPHILLMFVLKRSDFLRESCPHYLGNWCHALPAHSCHKISSPSEGNDAYSRGSRILFSSQHLRDWEMLESRKGPLSHLECKIQWTVSKLTLLIKHTPQSCAGQRGQIRTSSTDFLDFGFQDQVPRCFKATPQVVFEGISWSCSRFSHTNDLYSNPLNHRSCP